MSEIPNNFTNIGRTKKRAEPYDVKTGSPYGMQYSRKTAAAANGQKEKNYTVSGIKPDFPCYEGQTAGCRNNQNYLHNDSG